MNIDQEWYRRLSRYKHYNYDIYRDFFNDEEKYQEHFNMNVFETVNTVLRHTQKYLAMSPEEIQQERIDFHQEHRNNRP
jgi:hypothetical protein